MSETGLREAHDFIAEVEELHGFLTTLRQTDWDRHTTFMDWTPWDVVAHLHFFDLVSLPALTDPDAFAARRDALMQDWSAGMSNKDLARRELGELAAADLLERWRTTAARLGEATAASSPDARLPWFGPDMGVRMFITARQMETWAHGQEIYDLKKTERTNRDRIKNICVIGVKTYSWTFANRGLKPPGPAPYIRLTAPSGEVWEWNVPDANHKVEGSAVEFAQVVTQTRNVADTNLEVRGEAANRWMQIAQCFAGPAVDPPEPGARA